jgi:hypothetical protein
MLIGASLWVPQSSSHDNQENGCGWQVSWRNGFLVPLVCMYLLCWLTLITSLCPFMGYTSSHGYFSV